MTPLSRPGVRIAAFVTGLAAVFGLLFGVGRAVGPWDSDPAPAHSHLVGDEHPTTDSQMDEHETQEQS
ncbi:hypothetical protein [Gordonia zhaorongruii]|uniref:hypothetical protein n=1 Tax=Gordonia zhaorongruii TaxID=2597659 RepID=UPI00117F5C7E|nr:hypothetical protein [Gordonia zhaorongruii]